MNCYKTERLKIIFIAVVFNFYVSTYGLHLHQPNSPLSEDHLLADKINDTENEEFKLLILHTNDMHSRILETSSSSNPMCRDEICYGGLSRLKLVSKQLKEKYEKENWSVLFLNAGDNFQGSPFYSIHKEAIIKDLIPDLGFDVMDFGSTGGVSIDDEIRCLHSEVSRLKASNVDLVIALGHSGYETDKRIAREVTGIDLVIGGHSHTFLWNGTIGPSKEKVFGDYPTWVDRIFEKGGVHQITRVPVVQAYAYTKYLGFLKMNFEKTVVSHKTKGKVRQLRLKSASGNPILLSSRDFGEDIYMKNKIIKWKKRVDEQINNRIGKTKVFLEGDGNICRNQECNLGNLVVDAFVDYSVRHMRNNSMIPIAFVHSGSIRANIDSPDGKILFGDLLSALPYSNKLVYTVLKGKTIYEIFEHSVSGIEFNLGRFLQVSGIKIVYDITKPVRNRVESIVARCKQCHSQYKPVLYNEEYEVVTVDELVEGGDGYTEFENNTYKVNYLGATDFESVLQYLKNHSPVYPEIEGRIKFSRKSEHSQDIKEKN